MMVELWSHNEVADRKPSKLVIVVDALVALAVPAYLLSVGAGLAPLVGPVSVALGLIAAFSIARAVRRYKSLTEAHEELILIRAEQHEIMSRDPLTQLKNRSAFHAVLDELTVKGGVTTLLYFDLDRFKDVNDNLGHKVGDLLLVEVARRVETVLTDATVFARLGGDEFAAIIPSGSKRPPEEHGLAIVEAINHPFIIEGNAVEVGASVGIAVGDPAIDGAHELLRRADTAMYEAKGGPNGACRVFDDVLDGRQMLESSIRVELGRSIIQNELALHYQPIVDSRTGALSSCEALLRWRSQQMGDVSPATLIPIAEDSGQIMQLTEWTMESAFEAILALEDLPVAVNISPVYFKHPDFVQRVFDKMLAARIRPELLTIELTEGVLISNFDQARKSIAELREVGVKVFLDDFGTGYSSLSYLQHFQLDGLKLDKSFLRNTDNKRQSTQIIRAVIEFGHSLDMRVVVEGVESDWQARLLQLLGCDLLQGFEIGVPMPLDALQQYRKDLIIAQAAQPTIGAMPADIIDIANAQFK
jgi:diguanylate cyclase (GGDEF)-like protein